MSRWLAGALHRLIRGLALLGQLVLLFMVVTVCHDVIMRYVLVAAYGPAGATI